VTPLDRMADGGADGPAQGCPLVDGSAGRNWMLMMTLMRMAADNRPPGAFSAALSASGLYGDWPLAPHIIIRLSDGHFRVGPLLNSAASAGCCGWPCWAATRHVRDPGVMGSVPSHPSADLGDRPPDAPRRGAAASRPGTDLCGLTDQQDATGVTLPSSGRCFVCSTRLFPLSMPIQKLFVSTRRCSRSCHLERTPAA
jgi:hypothetical protein